MGNKYNKNKQIIDRYRINDDIPKYDSVRLIYKDTNGNINNKIVTMREALTLSDNMGLDLIEINRKTTPPILKMEDYSKFLYEQKKLEKQKRKNTSVLKEIQLSTNITEHDLSIKANKARDFINSGDKVKVVLTMRGRELSRREESKKCLYLLITQLEDVAVPENMPKDEGNKSIVILRRKQ